MQSASCNNHTYCCGSILMYIQYVHYVHVYVHVCTIIIILIKKINIVVNNAIVYIHVHVHIDVISYCNIVELLLVAAEIA